MRREVIMGVLLLVSAATIGQFSAQPVRSASQTEAGARAFMKGYEEDLREHRREALAARYSHKGAFLPSEASGTPLSFQAISDLYRGEWKGPETFEWRDLSYEVLSPDAVVVAGSFLWREASASEAIAYSYSNLFVREGGALRIRLEHEARKPIK